ncbi:MAG TPA: AzlC family ABC transporter permease [Egibacteraceae bacterium]|nr:AzlC family ABC transporter permease [Egibacteraceae bacterium]
MSAVLPVPAAATRRLAGALDPDGVRDILPIVVSVIPFAAVIGVTIAQLDTVPAWVGILSGPLIYAGTAQLAALTLFDSGAGVAAVLGAVAVINARLTMYGAAMEPLFRQQPAWFRWLAPHFLVDQTYAIAEARPQLRDPRRFRRYWLTAGLVLGVAWTATMAAAVLLGPVLPAASPLDFAATATFVGLLVPRLRQRVARRPALIAAVVGLLVASMPNGIGLLIAAAAGLMPALLGRTSP